MRKALSPFFVMKRVESTLVDLVIIIVILSVAKISILSRYTADFILNMLKIIT